MRQRLWPVFSRLMPGLIWLACFLLLAEVQVGGDGQSYYAYVRSGFIDGDLNLYNEDGTYNLYRQPMTPHNARTSAGYAHSQFSVGPAILWTPFFLIGHVWAGVAGLPQDGYVFPYLLSTTLGTAFYGAWGLYLTYYLVKAYSSSRNAAWATLALGLGSGVTFYVYKDATYSHALSFFTVSLLLHWWQKTRKKDPWAISRMLLLGGLVGLAALVRWQNLLFGVIPGLEIAVEAFRAIRSRSPGCLRRVLRSVGSVSAGAVIAFSPQFFTWQVLYRRWVLVPQGGGFLRWLSSEVVSVLFSPYHGLIPYTPVALLGIIGLILLMRKRVLTGVACAAAVGLQLVVSGAVADWWAGYSFGMRRMINCTSILALGIGVLLEHIKDRIHLQRALKLLIIVLVLWNLLLVIEVGQRSWLDPEDRTWGFYLSAAAQAKLLVAQPWLVWKLGSSYFPTLVYGIFRRDSLVLSSVVLLLGAAGFVPWMGRLSRATNTRSSLAVMAAVLVAVDGYILVSHIGTRELYATDLSRSPSPLLYTRLDEGDVYEGMLVPGALATVGDRVVEIVDSDVETAGLEVLWSWGGVSPDTVVEIAVSDRAGSDEERFLLKPAEFLSAQGAQRLRWLEPYPTPMFTPYWLLPERFDLRQQTLYLSEFKFDHPRTPALVWFRVPRGEGDWQVHSLVWTAIQD